jgi:isopenicillin-N N-acyltransferase-like protein
VQLLSRRLLEDARDLDEAVAIATTGPMSASTSLTVVEGRERSGRAVSVELFPAGHGLVEPNGDLLVRTNHFVSEAGAAGCTAHAIGPSTQIRRDKLVDALTGTTPAPVEVLDAMHDHADEGGVCAHPDTSLDPDEWHATLATVTLDTAGRRLDVIAGGPCAR